MGKKILVAVLAILAVIYIGFWVTAPSSVDASQYQALVDKYDVQIVRDKYAVPHIFGARDVDAAFGLAYAHAQDDFATMQDVLLVTRGKLATLHGADSATTDYLVQFMGVWDVVNAGYDTRISQQTRDHAEAYADGVNYYASQNPENIAAGLLPVTGKDIIAGFTFKTPLFYGFDQAVAAVVEGRYGTGLDKLAHLQVTNDPQPDLGSQGISIAPSRSEDGYTRLLVNSHQPLTGPVAWYEARIKTDEGWDMAGSTFPGSPLILHGHGPTLGWSSTVNKPDLVDVYQLTINPDNENQYLLDGTWQDFEIEDAAIDVTFWGPIRWTFHETIYRSKHGPVFKTETGAFALRWAGMDEVRTLEQMLAMNKARTHQDFEAALSMTASPSINHVYADKDGNIAHYYNAMMPKRPIGEAFADIDWTGLLPGDRSDLIWQGYYPFERMPQTVNPPSGYVYNANNTPYRSSTGQGQPQAADYEPSMGIQTNMTNRALRIEALFGGDESISRDELHSYKYDNRYAKGSVADLIITRLLAMTFEPNSDLHAGQKLLQDWDLSTDADSRMAALGVMTTGPFIIADMQQQPEPDLTETFQTTLDLLQTHFGQIDPKWGDVNRLVRGDKSWPLSGAPDVLRAVYGVFDEDVSQQQAVAGDSYIMFVEWAPDGTLSSHSIHNFGSATLDATSSHFDDQAPMFASEKERRLPLDKATLMAEKTSELRLGGGS
ncbi:penicillin acylase family protein [uncultured Paraglaciecola sp.]|uniref:penicillin acylase family protein n=1 Tax=uncultured Paraglaciecola sp. TaxID=1765024 RepID=UPI002606607C|nr:acylase [uncultured Paraglaciecola sp.]